MRPERIKSALGKVGTPEIFQAEGIQGLMVLQGEARWSAVPEFRRMRPDANEGSLLYGTL